MLLTLVIKEPGAHVCPCAKQVYVVKAEKYVHICFLS